MSKYSQGGIFNSIINEYDRVRSARSAAELDVPLSTQRGIPSSVDKRVSIPGGTTSVQVYDYSRSPFMDSNTVFERTDTGIVGTPYSESMSKTGDIVTSGEAAVESPVGRFGFNQEQTTFGNIVSNMITAMTPMGAGALFSGDMVINATGREVAVPGGMYGKFAKRNIEKQYEVAEKIRAGTPGYHQFYQGNNLVSIVPQEILGKHLGFTTLGTVTDSRQALNQYAAMFGYDPETVDFFSRPGQKSFGETLNGFVPGSGGYDKSGQFVDVTGGKSSTPRDSRAHFGLVSDIYGQEFALDALSRASIDESTRAELEREIASGQLTAKEYRDSDGNVVGYGTGVGGYVTSVDPVTGERTATNAQFGSGAISPQAYNSLKSVGLTSIDFNPLDLPGYEPADPTDPYSFGSYREPTSSDRESTTPGKGSGNFNVQDIETQDLGFDPSYSQAAKGGFISDEQAQVSAQAPVVNEAGFIGEEPEKLPEGMTVADDTPIDVPEGTFVLNAAAVEFMGSADVKLMILSAMKEAEKQGIDIKQRDAKIPKEELVSLVVSKGEVIIPPELAKIIGYDRLNKINNRGKAEVEKRIEENGQSPEAEAAQQTAAEGGEQFNPEQSIVDYHYNTIRENNVGRDEKGRPITVYSTSILVPEGKYKGKFALVPGYIDGSTEYTEDQLYDRWKDEIEAGKWPIDISGEASGERAQKIHQIMDKDANEMPELQRRKMAPGGFAGNIDSRQDALAYARGAVEATEGVHDKPVVPTQNSGLTVSLGLDLGQHSEFDLKNRYNMSEEFIQAAKPFLAKKQGGKGPLGNSAKQIYQETQTDFTPFENEVVSTYIPKKFEQFLTEYPEFNEAPPKDQGALFSMYYLGGLDRYQTLKDVYKETGDIPYSIHKGLLTLKDKSGRPVFNKDDSEYNRAVNLLTFYYTGDDADVLENRNAGQRESYAKDMLKTQLSDRERTAKVKKTGSFID